MRTIRRHMRRSQFAPTLPVFSQNLATLSWVNNDSANITSVTDELDFQPAHFPQIDIDMLHLDDPLTDNNLDDDQSFENSSEPNSVMNPASTVRCQSLTKILWLSPSLCHLLKTRIPQSYSLLTQLSSKVVLTMTYLIWIPCLWSLCLTPRPLQARMTKSTNASKDFTSGLRGSRYQELQKMICWHYYEMSRSQICQWTGEHSKSVKNRSYLS